MHIVMINPNSTKLITESIEKTAGLIATPKTEINTITSSLGPVSIESYYEKITASLGVVEEIKKFQEKGAKEADAFIIACYGDPGLDAAREVTDCPIIGIAQASMYFTSLVARKFSILTLISRTAVPVEDLVKRYGMEGHLASIRATPLCVLDYENDSEKGMEVLVKEGRLAIEQDGAEALILGCAGMADYAEQLEKNIGVPVFEGVTSALKMAEGLVSLKKKTSKIRTYDWPPVK